MSKSLKTASTGPYVLSLQRGRGYYLCLPNHVFVINTKSLVLRSEHVDPGRPSHFNDSFQMHPLLDGGDVDRVPGISSITSGHGQNLLDSGPKSHYHPTIH